MTKTRMLTGLCLMLAIVVIPARAFDHSHARFTTLLNTHVNEAGQVDYKALATDRGDLNAYLKDVATVTREDIGTWTRDQKLAYWMNAYNAYTIKIILDNVPITRARGLTYRVYPKNSIRQIVGVWDVILNRAGGRRVTLGQIENDILRTELTEPRIHFTIVCASAGCPNLANSAYTPDGLEDQLTAAATAFVRNPGKVRVDAKTGKLHLSKIFSWYTDDFSGYTGASGYKRLNGVVSFITQHVTAGDRKALEKKQAGIKWLPYDWSLNTQ